MTINSDERYVANSTLSRMFLGLEGRDQSQSGYDWRKGWNDALRQAMDYAQPTPSVPTALLVAVANLVAQMEIVSRVGFVDTPNDRDSCAAFCIAEGTWLEFMSAVESLVSALAVMVAEQVPVEGEGKCSE